MRYILGQVNWHHYYSQHMHNSQCAIEYGINMYSHATRNIRWELNRIWREYKVREREGGGWAIFWHADKSFATLSYLYIYGFPLSCSHTLNFSSFCDMQGWLATNAKVLKMLQHYLNAFAYSWDNMHTCIIIYAHLIRDLKDATLLLCCLHS